MKHGRRASLFSLPLHRFVLIVLILLMSFAPAGTVCADSDGKWMKPFEAFPDLPQGEFKFDFTTEQGLAPTAVQMHFVGGSYNDTCPVYAGGNGITPDAISNVSDPDQTKDLIVVECEEYHIYLGNYDYDHGTDFGTYNGRQIMAVGSIDFHYVYGAAVHNIDMKIRERFPEYDFSQSSPFIYTYNMNSGSGHWVDCNFTLYRDGDRLYAIATDRIDPYYLVEPGTGWIGPNKELLCDTESEGFYNAFFEITALFMGEYEGQEVVIARADKEEGEKGFHVAPGIIAAAGGASLLFFVGKGLLKKRSKTKTKTEPAEDEYPDESEDYEDSDDEDTDDEDSENRSSFELRVKKDFGDTLFAGEKQTVYARMVEITSEGTVKPADDLTRRIHISSPDGVKITDQKLLNGYMAAVIEIPEEAASGGLKNIGTVSFVLAGVYKLNLQFKIMLEEIRFFQENLTLPAVYDEITMLPFSVEAGDDADITAIIEPKGSYEAEVEKSDEEGIMYVKIREISKTKLDPGTVESFELHVIMQRGKLQLMADLPLYRFHMGFKVEMDPAIACHFELKDEVWMSGGNMLGGAKDYQPARTNVTMAVYDWDEDAHEVLVAAVTPGEEDVILTAVEADNQDKLKKLGVRLLYGPDSATETGRHGTFICTEAVLDPPARFRANLSIHTAFNGKEYTFEREVLMASQKVRTPEEITSNFEKDQRYTTYLQNLKNSIENGEDLEHLFPLVKYIDIMLEGYSNTYGYDDRQIERVKDIRTRYLEGSLLGANAETHPITFADELEMYITAFIDTGASVEQSLGFWGNLAAGVISLGHSDAVFAAFKAAKSMKDYVARGGDSAWGAFFVGAASATTDFAMSRVTDAAMGTAIKGAKYAGKSAVGIAGKLSPKTMGSAINATEQAVKKTKEYLSDKVGKKIKNVLEKSSSDKQKVRKTVQKDIIESNRRPMSAEDIRLENLESRGNKAAKVKLDDLDAARQVAETWPTSENIEFYRKKVLAVQQDKSAMYQLKNMAGADDLRASFNREMKTIYENTDKSVRQYFESQGIPLKKNVQSATNSNAEALKKGQTVTMDRDVTYYAEDGGLLKQAEAEKAYERAFYKETKGIDAPTDEAAHEWAKLNDQSVVQKASLENYGNQHDLDAMLKNHGEDLIDPVRVGKVASNKGLEWMKEGQELIRQGFASSDPKLGENLIEKGIMLRKEGMRQITKQYRYVDARDISKACRSGELKITDDLRYGVEMFNNTFTDGPAHISVARCESLLKEKGLTLEEVAVTLGKVIELIG